LKYVESMAGPGWFRLPATSPNVSLPRIPVNAPVIARRREAGPVLGEVPAGGYDFDGSKNDF